MECVIKAQLKKDYKNNHIPFEEAYKKIKQIQRNEQKKDYIIKKRRIRNISYKFYGYETIQGSYTSIQI